MQKNPDTTLSIMTAALAITAMLATTALAESSKKSHKTAPQSSAAASEADGTPETVSSSTTGHRDHKSGPAWRTIGGTVKQIKGNTYTVEDYEGNQVQLFVGQDTKHLRQKKVGDTVRAEVTRGGFANSIQ
ncbi:MAG: hypothetical protein HP494_14080 [Nitrospira sp.]|nr:hypothetical protein [Nitrospira sp.]MBH0205706.1 hypothetical protein [Nitrospira sp.]